MIDLRNLAEERPLSLPEAADYIAKLTGHPKPNVSTLWRWCQKGCKGVKLESICIGAKRFVTVSAIERFIKARSQMSAPAEVVSIDIAPSAPRRVERLAAQRRDEIESARKRLDELTRSGSPSRRRPA
jgi:hypothetical protein